MRSPFSRSALDRHRYAAGFCLLGVVVPYWPLLLGPGAAPMAGRFLAVAAAASVDALLILGIRATVISFGRERGALRYALFLMACLALFFVVGFRNAAGVMIFVAAQFPDFFLALPQAEAVAVFMFSGLAFAVFEYALVRRLIAADGSVSDQ
ncbi:MAG: hypothetical protein AUJ52_14510 [Elusimicrobia bacterium CG1_02_63_36]|nr:MAG: hypothetical protein AUJ52_14510 [Elusimicrobia bacterium CG1_02_63_36]